jgi:indoleamine 2,3-dioxygenase
MTCINTFTGAFDEAWFYLVPLAIEIVGAPIMVSVNEAQKNILADNPAEVLKHVSCIADTIANMSPLLKKMYDKCDPAVFWRRTRMYSGGSLNSKEFPNGVFYEGVEEV